ncbi:hypothetical protein BOX15_Mlig032094g2 [Macrostomum lignano]|uniref:Phosphatidylinositol-glycan biosynthesis class W protein n=1 Tax=Macrostomum lignano TaxID=282301 RepID=A0A267G9M3_9PLAT|nr:hypothetical protein BOX15_Mlig032094g2 [Macrostomum lignano]
MEAVWRFFAEQYEPRNPFSIELHRNPTRSLYYETFLATSALTASVLLIYSLEYAAARSCCWRLLKLSSLAHPVQFLILVVPFLACVLDYPYARYTRFVLQFDAFCCLASAACCLLKRLRCRRSRGGMLDKPPPSTSTQASSVEQSNRPPTNDFQTVYRSIVYLSTAVCIFARDQPCWRNDFSKADSFGTALMDVGLGCFVVCIGSLGPTATRAKIEVNRSAAMKKAGAQFILLAFCGLVKSISVAIDIALDQTVYEESWHEYGVHWNAFYTLAVAKLGGTALELYILPDRMSPLLAALLAGAGHETLLASAGIAGYVLAPGQLEPYNRASLFGANREGICSMLGIPTLYLIGLQLGRWTGACAKQLELGADPRRQAVAMRRLLGRVASLLAGCLLYRVLLGCLPQLLLPESRRLLNPSYAAWIAAFSAFAHINVWLMMAAKLLMTEPQNLSGFRMAPIHLRQVDVVGLMYFLVANLLTGLVDFLVKVTVPDRESIDGWPCFVLVLSYMSLVYPAARLANRLLNVRAVIAKLTGCVSDAASAWRPCRLTAC